MRRHRPDRRETPSALRGRTDARVHRPLIVTPRVSGR
jgi:hypothetical protein